MRELHRSRIERAAILAASAVYILAILSACATAALAVQPLALEEDPFAIPPDPREFSHVYDGSRHAPSLEMSERIRQRLGGDWRVVTWNSTSSCPRRVWGSGVDVAPGLRSAQEAEQAARAFILANPDFFGGARPQNLALYRVTNAMGKWAVMLQQTVNGVPVHGAIVTLTFTESGRLYAFGANYYQGISMPPAASMSREAAIEIARAELPYDAASEMTRAPDETVILPVFDSRGDGATSFRLAHVTEVSTAEPYGLYRTWVDAASGEILRRENQVSQAYSGRAVGDVETSGYCAGNVPETPFANMNVVISGLGTAVTDANGDFSIGGNSDPLSYTASFNGPVVNVNCMGCGGDAEAEGTIEPDVFESIVFDSTDYRADERDVFYTINGMYGYILSIDSTWTYPKVTANVNINSSCNANWGGTVLNFFRAAGGCQNTGRLADVVAHEYGHCVQFSLLGGSGPNGQGEGNADIAATFYDNGSLIGVGIVNCSDGLSCPGSPCRDCENVLQWPTDAVGQPIHSAGRVICGFNWDARQALEAKYGAEAGKLAAAQLWHYSRKMYGNPSYDQDDQVLDYFVVNDNDGNLLDGTPDYAELRDAAVNHGFPYPSVISIVHTPLENTTDVTNPYLVVATITSPGSLLDPDSLLVRYRVGGSGEYTALTMTPTENPDEYAAAIPAQECGSFVEYYISADDTAGVREIVPPGAPAAAHGFHVAATLYIQNFETSSDWTTDVSHTASTGAFVRIDPIGTNYQPGDDATPSPGAFAWITAQNQPGQDGIDDVDGGIAATRSPIIDMTNWDDVRLSFKYFHGQRDGGNDPGADFFRIQISNDGGLTYPVDLVSIGDVFTIPMWTPVSVDVASVITPTSLMRLRVQAADDFPQTGDVIEGGIDDIVITACAPPPPPPPDTLPPVVEVLSPNGGEALVIDSTASITWTATDDRGVTGVDILLSRDGGAAYDTTIAAGEANDGEYTWSLANLESTNLARIKIMAADSASNIGADTSAANFTIGPPPSAPPIVLAVAPNGGEMLQGNSAFTITWTSGDDIGVTGVDIRLSTNAGADFSTIIASGLVDTGSYDWLVANVTTTEALVQLVVTDANYQTAADTSDTTFTIAEVPTGVEIAGGAPDRAFLGATMPEPFSHLTTVRFGLARPGPVTLAIYSIEGRLIRSLVSGGRAAGAYEVAWDGRDGDGQPVTSGRYFIRLTTPEATMTRGATFLR